MKQAVFVFHCYVSEKSKLYLYFVTTLVMKYAVFVFDCWVSEKGTLYLYFIATLVISARSVLYLYVTLVISAYYICNSLLR